MVWINDHMFSHGACQCAWGGVKDSGLGRTHSKFGLYECVNVKLRVWEGSTLRDPWWHPYDETVGKAFRATANLLYGPAAARGAPCGTAPAANAARRPPRARRDPTLDPALAMALTNTWLQRQSPRAIPS